MRGNFAGELAIIGLSEALQIRISIYQPDSSTPLIYGKENENTAIDLAFVGRCHYDLIVDTSSTPTEDDSSFSNEFDSDADTYSEENSPSIEDGQRLSRGVVESIINTPASISQASQQSVEKITLTSLIQNELRTEATCVQFLRQCHILPAQLLCPSCGVEMRDCPPTSSQRYGLFRCPKCTVRCSYRGICIIQWSFKVRLSSLRCKQQQHPRAPYLVGCSASTFY